MVLLNHKTSKFLIIVRAMIAFMDENIDKRKEVTMTSNQLKFAELQNQRAHNYNQDLIAAKQHNENVRSNKVREQETARHNYAQEVLSGEANRASYLRAQGAILSGQAALSQAKTKEKEYAFTENTYLPNILVDLIGGTAKAAITKKLSSGGAKTPNITIIP